MIRSRARGFTLVELMVSLVAGLMVSLAVVGLARSSTNTFHEQARIAGVEASLRVASERLRADLTRAGFLSTPNIQLDPRIAHQQNFLPFIPPAAPALQDLQSIRIGVAVSQGGTLGPNNLATMPQNNLAPDDIIIGGDFTTDAEFHMNFNPSVAPPRFSFDYVPGPPQTSLSQDPNLYPFLKQPNPAIGGFENTQMLNAFMPGGISNFVRIKDPCGWLHFGRVVAAGYTGTTGYVDIDSAGSPSPPGWGLVTPQNASNSSCANASSAPTSFDFEVAPVQRVRWYLGPNTNPATEADQTLAEGNVLLPATQKFNLYRQMLDVTGAANAALLPEVVAEYAIDMKFGITVQDPGNQALTVIDLDNDLGASGVPLKGPTTQAVSPTGITHDASTLTNTNGTKYNTLGPQNVKSIRFRLAVRAPIADRRVGLPIVSQPGYKTRYCVNPGCTQWARVRTIVSEVALVNQNQPMFCSNLGANANNCPP
jgi:type II secretory pathway pseudopilin PulG